MSKLKMTEEQKERKRVSNKTYRETHKEEIRAAKKVWREAHKEEMKAYLEVYREAHKEERKVYDRALYEIDKEKIKSRAKAWQEANKEKHNTFVKAWGAKNLDKRRAHAAKRRAKKALVINKPIRDNFLDILKEIYDDRCAYCNNHSEKWELDHFIPLELKGHHAEYNLVLACPTCNRSKGHKEPNAWLEKRKITFKKKPYMEVKLT